MIACMQTIVIPPQGHAATSDGDGWETVCRPGRPRPTPGGERTAPRIRDAWRDATARAPHPGLNTSLRPGRPLVPAASVDSLGEGSDHPPAPLGSVVFSEESPQVGERVEAEVLG